MRGEFTIQRIKIRWWKGGAALGILAAVALSVSACGRTHVENVKLTVNVDDDGAPVSASGVFKFICSKTDNRLGEWGLGGCFVKGEAIPIDLGARGVAFLVMTGGQDRQWGGMVKDVFSARPDPTAQSWDLQNDHLPRFVAFHSLSDSRTVFPVDPGDFAQTFGRSVELRSVRAEISNEEVTNGRIQSYLPWVVNGIYSTYLTGETSTGNRTLPEKLQHLHFRSE
jgi:hypothetical protein